MKPTLLASGYGFLEGPRADADGGLYYSDRTSVYHRRADGVVEPLLERGVGGIALHRDGGVVLSGPELVHLRDGRLRTAFSLEGDGEVNDILAAPDGALYAGVVRLGPDGDYQRTLPGDLWRIHPGGRAERLWDDVAFANGIGLAPDGATLYLADSFRRQVWAFDLDARGAVGGHRTLSTAAVDGYPDGLAVDVEGCLWLAMYEGGCVARLDPAGAVLATLPLPARQVTSLCFAGPEHTALIVVTCDSTDDPAAGGGVYRLELGTPGVPTYQTAI